MEKVNQHGLKRYIPAAIRKRIRKEAGFGCVICGNVVSEYEHIEPEFHNAQEHDPEKMTLLCGTCHGKVTRKQISKKIVWQAKANPKALQDGYVYDMLYCNTDEMEFRIGNCKTKNCKTILTIYGKPILWFEPPEFKNEPSKLCCIFYDENGENISYVNRNEFYATSKSEDIHVEATIFTIKSSKKKLLKINISGYESFQISVMNFKYLDTEVEVQKMVKFN